jgi:hypothetical protein
MSRRRKLNRTQIIPFKPKRTKAAKVPSTRSPDTEYRVGPGHPPKEHQFKPGQSGNPDGKRKQSSFADIKALLERSLTKRLRRGEFTKAEAGIEKLVDQFARGDRYARKDLISISEKFGVDLTGDRAKTSANASSESLTERDRELLADYVRRHAGDNYRDARIVQLSKPGSSNKTKPVQFKENKS